LVASAVPSLASRSSRPARVSPARVRSSGTRGPARLDFGGHGNSHERHHLSPARRYRPPSPGHPTPNASAGSSGSPPPSDARRGRPAPSRSHAHVAWGVVTAKIVRHRDLRARAFNGGQHGGRQSSGRTTRAPESTPPVAVDLRRAGGIEYQSRRPQSRGDQGRCPALGLPRLGDASPVHVT